MSTAATADVPQTPSSQGDAWSWLMRSPWLCGTLVTCGVYAAIPYTGAWAPFWSRYLAGHPVEYAEVGLFVVGVWILVRQGLQLLSERQAVAWSAVTLSDPKNLPAAARAVAAQWRDIPAELRATHSARRLDDLAGYLQDRGDAEGLESHAQLLARQAVDRQHAEYGQLQTIFWAVPILGLLGTVMGITLSITHVADVTGSLAATFDTTAIAAVMTLILVFGSYFATRAETRVLADIDANIFKELVSPLSGSARRSGPMFEAETQAARDLLERTDSLITEQTALWHDSVEGLRTRWSQTVEAQRQQLATALSNGVGLTLGDHSDLLQRVRDQFLEACREFSREVAHQLEAAREEQTVQQQQLVESWRSAWSAMQNEMALERVESVASSQALLTGFTDQMQALSRQLTGMTSSLESQFAAVSRQSELLAEIVGHERNLAGLQSRLNDNLESLQAAETLQQSMHSLSGAIHLLTARVRPAA
jgi:biopolymer transport protein ExbB/TolQ